MLKSISYLCSEAFGDLVENVEVEAKKHQLDTRDLNLEQAFVLRGGAGILLMPFMSVFSLRCPEDHRCLTQTCLSKISSLTSARTYSQ